MRGIPPEVAKMIRPRVCVMDPDEHTRQLAGKTLGKHCDLLFTSPRALIDALEIFEPDLLITELDLPELSGFDLISIVQSDEHFRRIPIMVYSAVADLDSQKLAYRLGAMHFQVKPCRPSQFFKAAALFMRLASGEHPVRSHTVEEAERLIAERARAGEIHPLLSHVLAVRHHGEEAAGHFERAVRASVARSHPKSRK